MTRPSHVKGWCPGAHKPMMSGDGLIVRIRPIMAHLDAAQILGLCNLANNLGNGTLELTSRANLQVRGVSEAGHDLLLQALAGIGLLDVDPAIETKRNVIVAPQWTQGDLTDRLGRVLLDALASFPQLPGKMGFAIDTGSQAQLQDASADFRFELSDNGALLLRADGAKAGRHVSEDTAFEALCALVDWFVETDGPNAGRMKRHLGMTALPPGWTDIAPRGQKNTMAIGAHGTSWTLGAAFGQIEADALADVMSRSGATALRVTHNRCFTLLNAMAFETDKFVTRSDDPALTVNACPGAPACQHASVSTRNLARQLTKALPSGTSLHVSGCEKGCACPRPSDVTLVGRDGAFDLVRQGAPWDEPEQSGLCANSLHEMIQF